MHYFVDARNWTSAESKCFEIGGHLASLHSDVDRDTLLEFVASHDGHEEQAFWIGLNDRVTEVSVCESRFFRHSACLISQLFRSEKWLYQCFPLDFGLDCTQRFFALGKRWGGLIPGQFLPQTPVLFWGDSANFPRHHKIFCVEPSVLNYFVMSVKSKHTLNIFISRVTLHLFLSIIDFLYMQCFLSGRVRVE